VDGRIAGGISVYRVSHLKRTGGNQPHAGGRVGINDPVDVDGIGDRKLDIIHPVGSATQGGGHLDGIIRARQRVVPYQRAIGSERHDGGCRRPGNAKEACALCSPVIAARQQSQHDEERRQFSFHISEFL
jgi:hypothetical protein